jgi:tetratricopeptide (TPR) repeat protein
VSDERQIQMLIQQADRARREHAWSRAIDLLRRALTLDPDHARAHASLALALLGAKRLHGATIEAGIGLAHDGNDGLCHYAAAAVRVAERRLVDAWSHCLVAIQADPHDVDAHVLGATVRRLQGEREAARELLERALELQPDHLPALIALARVELEANRLAEAARVADTALTNAPEDVDAHVIAGYIALRQNDLVAAEQHGRFALTQNAADQDALELWTAIKARKSWSIGLWWRFNAFVSLRSEAGQIGILIGSFVIARLAMILAGALDLEVLEQVLSLAWLGFCAYTWVAPGVFRSMLEKDIKTVVLDSDF